MLNSGPLIISEVRLSVASTTITEHMCESHKTIDSFYLGSIHIVTHLSR